MEQQQQRQRFHKACGWLKTAVRSSNAKKWQQLLYGDTASRVYVHVEWLTLVKYGTYLGMYALHLFMIKGEKHQSPRAR